MLMDQVFIGSVFIAGLLSFFSPCIFPLLPVYVAHLGGVAPGSEMKTVQLGKLRIHPFLIGNTLFFILGLSFVFVLLGFGAGALGSIINNSWFIVICGVVVVLFGIFQTGVIKLLFMQREKKLTIEWKGKRALQPHFCSASRSALVGRHALVRYSPRCLVFLQAKVRRHRVVALCSFTQSALLFHFCCFRSFRIC